MREAFVLEEEIATLNRWIGGEHKPGEIKQLGNVVLIANSTGGLSAIHIGSYEGDLIEIESISMEGKIITYTSIDRLYRIRILTMADLEERRKRYEERTKFPNCCRDF